MNTSLPKNTWLVYILQCSDLSYYTGITNNLEDRINKHNQGKGAKYTRGRGPVTLLKYWEFPSKSEASKEEYRIKQLSRNLKIKLINSSK